MIDLSPADLLFLLRTDADPFNRWQAAQMLAMRALIAGTSAARKGEARVETDGAFIDALGDVAENEALEPAFRAQVLQLPGEADIAREIGRDVDPDAIFAARQALRAAIARRVGAASDRGRRPARQSQRLFPLRAGRSRAGTAGARQCRARPDRRQPRPACGPGVVRRFRRPTT